jgi:hypothetical protein
MVQQYGADDLTPWLAQALESDLRFFAEGLRQDLAAVWTALAAPSSNGQTEGSGLFSSRYEKGYVRTLSKLSALI